MQIGCDYDTVKMVVTQTAIMAALDGVSEAEAARLTRFSRLALRTALGK